MNTDIISELWKYVNVDNMKIISMVSKDFNICYKNMSDIDIIKRKYKEYNSFDSFILAISKKIVKNYSYPKAKFISKLSTHFIRSISKNDKLYIENDIHLVYYWIILLYHTVNNNYTEILNTIKNIDFTKKVNVQIIYLFLNIMNKNDYTIYSACYSSKKLSFMRTITFIYIVMFSKNQFQFNKKFMEVVLNKKQLAIQAIEDFQISQDKWLYPKKFCKKLINIIKL